ncbi:Branched-chain-amino-acid aminotransferase [Planctomycetales bacterium 10988]|nr:Branched-chain-amino-acid aminotransferase [Planctomycetales bacterium 10988]
MSLKIYMSGEYVAKEDAKVSVYDHGFLYGDGVFEGMRSYGGTVFRLDAHLDRLWESAKAIWLEIPISKEEMVKAVYETLEINDLQNAYIRLIITRGAGTLGLDPDLCSNSQVIIIADSVKLYPEEFYQNGLEIITAATIRNHSAALSPRIKSLNYLNNILAKIEAIQAGKIEALMLNTKGEVAECTGDNIFIVKNDQLLTPPLEAGILDGITRQAVMELGEKVGLTVREIPLTRHDIFVADESFLTGTAAEIIPVVKLDLRVIGDGTPGKKTLEMLELFGEMTQGETASTATPKVSSKATT